MQFVPVSPTETHDPLHRLRAAGRAARDEGCALPQLAHQPQVNSEDKDLIEGVQAGMASSSYTTGPLGEGEVCLRSFGRRMRALFPEAREGSPPPKGWSINRKAPRPQ